MSWVLYTGCIDSGPCFYRVCAINERVILRLQCIYHVFTVIHLVLDNGMGKTVK